MTTLVLESNDRLLEQVGSERPLRGLREILDSLLKRQEQSWWRVFRVLLKVAVSSGITKVIGSLWLYVKIRWIHQAYHRQYVAYKAFLEKNVDRGLMPLSAAADYIAFLNGLYTKLNEISAKLDEFLVYEESIYRAFRKDACRTRTDDARKTLHQRADALVNGFESFPHRNKIRSNLLLLNRITGKITVGLV